MAKKVSLDTLKKRAARLKIKGRSAMNKAQLQAACDACTPKKQTRRKPALKPRQRSTQYGGRPINRRRTMGETYNGFENKAAFWVAINMANDAGLYEHFKILHEQGEMNHPADLRDAWFDIIAEEIFDIDRAQISFHFARSANPYIADMAQDYLNTITIVGWTQIFDDFYDD